MKHNLFTEWEEYSKAIDELTAMECFSLAKSFLVIGIAKVWIWLLEREK